MIILQLGTEELKMLVKNAVNETLQESKPKNELFDLWFDLEQLCNYLPDKPVKATVYGWVSKRLIPYHKKGKALSFLKSEIDGWLKEGLRITATQMAQEITQETDSFLGRKKNGGKP